MFRHLLWLAVMVWGLCITALGMQAIDPAPMSPAELLVDGPVRPAIYLLAAGIVTCLVGLAGMVGWSRRHGDTDAGTPDHYSRLNH
jgi:hypothetical protein